MNRTDYLYFLLAEIEEELAEVRPFDDHDMTETAEEIMARIMRGPEIGKKKKKKKKKKNSAVDFF